MKAEGPPIMGVTPCVYTEPKPAAEADAFNACFGEVKDRPAPERKSGRPYNTTSRWGLQPPSL